MYLKLNANGFIAGQGVPRCITYNSLVIYLLGGCLGKPGRANKKSNQGENYLLETGKTGLHKVELFYRISKE
jgi:hypothetical protein